MTAVYVERGAVAPVQRSHHHNWDRLRLVAVIDVVGWHLGGHHLLAGIGLPLFHMLSVALTVVDPAEPASAPFVWKRVRRLGLPWLFWSMAIATLRVRQNLSAGVPPWQGLEPRMLLYGAAIHLWFLPFTLVVTLCARTLQRHTEGRPEEGCLLACLIGLALLLLPLPLQVSGGWPLDQWLFSLPACLLGYVLGRVHSGSFGEFGSKLRGLAIGAALGGLWLRIALELDEQLALHLLRFALALSALVCATWLPNRPDRLTSFARPLLLGVYVLHPVLYEFTLDPLLWKLGIGDVAWARVGAGLLTSSLCVLLLRRTPLRRVL